ncbi:MAG: PEP/pyruvate-binding domain-containing protein, partial [Candidatus Xenobia bacterium]
MDLIMPLSALRGRDVLLAGGKAARLGEMLAAGLPVPDGFCVTTDAYRNALALCPNSDPGTWLRQAPLPRQLEAAVRRACAVWRGLPVAVRSSAVAEDQEDASFAGQHDTWLDVVGCDAVLQRLRECWASLWTERAAHYREAHHLREEEAALGCIVQRMVQADIAGVMFTADP